MRMPFTPVHLGSEVAKARVPLPLPCTPSGRGLGAQRLVAVPLAGEPGSLFVFVGFWECDFDFVHEIGTFEIANRNGAVQGVARIVPMGARAALVSRKRHSRHMTEPKELVSLKLRLKERNPAPTP